VTSSPDFAFIPDIREMAQESVLVRFLRRFALGSAEMP